MTYMLTDKAGVRWFLPAPCWYWIILLFYVFVTLKDKERQFLFFDSGIWDPHGTEHLVTYFWSFYFLFPLIMASLHFHLLPIFLDLWLWASQSLCSLVHCLYIAQIRHVQIVHFVWPFLSYLISSLSHFEGTVKR